jgi:SMI1 / KNR4 family (SUKH-1)
MTVEWKKQIAIAFLVKQRIWELDQGRLWELHYPEVAATEEQLRAVEAHLGFSLPAQYRQFLECANGWQCFFLNVDLLGAEDLLGSDRMDMALEVLKWLEADHVLASSGHSQKELLPIGLSREDNTLFCISTPLCLVPNQVLWFSGKLVDTFPDFREFFLAMCDYNRLEVERLLGERANEPS